MLNIIGNIITGFFVGMLARFFYWGDVPMGFWKTTFLGIGGALVAGVLASLSNGQGIREGYNRAGCLASVIGAMALIFAGNRLGWTL